MFSHIMLGSNDIARSKAFYDALFGAIGGPQGVVDAKGRLTYAHDGGRFMVTQPLDGRPATAANGGTIGFTMDSPEQGEAWHAAGLAAGGQAVEDPPGERRMGAMALHLSYLRDPDGNKLCAVHRMPA